MGKRIELDFAESLSTNLALIGISHEADPEDDDLGIRRRKWFLEGQYIGSYTAHAGWAILHHFDQIGRIDLAIEAFANASGDYAA